MDRFSALGNEIAALLAPYFAGEKLTLGEEFPAGRRMAGAGLAIGLGGVAFSGGMGETGRAKLTLRFDILCPAGGTLTCHGVFNRLCDALLEQTRVREMQCGELRYDGELRAMTLTATALLEGMFSEQVDEETGELMREIVIRTKEGLI